MQSYFFIPGTLLHKIDNILQHGADEIIIDMEEVQPQENKQKARDIIKQYQEEGRFKNKIVFPRVNDRESGNLLQDVYQLTIPGIAGFMYPEAKKGDDIYFFDKFWKPLSMKKGP